MGIGAPLGPFADDGDAVGVGRPHTEMRTGGIVAADEVTAEVTIEPAMSAFAKKVDVVIGQHVLFGLAGVAGASPPAFPYERCQLASM